MGLGSDLGQISRGWRWGHRRLVPASVDPLKKERAAFPTDWARSEWALLARRFILEAGFAPLLAREIDVSIHGLDALASVDPPAVFVANHTSHLDAPLILTSLPRVWRYRTAVGAASDYFFDVWWRALGTTLAFNAFPVERAGARRSASVGRSLLMSGWSILVFPEGTRSKDGWIGKMKHGAAHLAIESNAPIVPIALRGTFQAMPKGRGWPVPGRPFVAVRFGNPVHPRDGETPSDLTGRVSTVLESTIHEEETSWWLARKAFHADAVPSRGAPQMAEWRRVWEASRPIGSPEPPVWRK